MCNQSYLGPVGIGACRLEQQDRATAPGYTYVGGGGGGQSCVAQLGQDLSMSAELVTLIRLSFSNLRAAGRHSVQAQMNIANEK